MVKALIKGSLRICLGVLPSPGHPTLAGPGLHLGWRLGWIRGLLWRPYWALRARLGGTRLIIGRRFSLQGSVQFRGPGTVRIGDDVIFGARSTPFTHDRAAIIEIGSCTFVNGTRFGCSRRITVGRQCILADARIMDTDFHAVHRRRNEPGMAAEVAPVKIGDNVWVAAGVGILKGVEIGDDSVIAFGAVVHKSLGSGKVFGGNPARELGPLPAPPR